MSLSTYCLLSGILCAGSCCDAECCACLYIETTYDECCNDLGGHGFALNFGGVIVCIPWSVSTCNAFVTMCVVAVSSVEQCFHSSFLYMHVTAASLPRNR